MSNDEPLTVHVEIRRGIRVVMKMTGMATGYMVWGGPKNKFPICVSGLEVLGGWEYRPLTWFMKKRRPKQRKKP